MWPCSSVVLVSFYSGVQINWYKCVVQWEMSELEPMELSAGFWLLATLSYFFRTTWMFHLETHLICDAQKICGLFRRPDFEWSPIRNRSLLGICELSKSGLQNRFFMHQMSGRIRPVWNIHAMSFEKNKLLQATKFCGQILGLETTQFLLNNTVCPY